jgi:hypothetical protein
MGTAGVAAGVCVSAFAFRGDVFGTGDGLAA